jgi:hypothetical protein
MTELIHACHACGATVTVDGRVMRREVCSSCEADLHVCLNCTFHDPGAQNQCREPVAEPVRDKDRSNYCTYFSFAVEASEAERESEADAAKRRLDSLFKL